MSVLLMFPLWSAVDASAGQVRYSGEGHAYHPTWSMDGRFIAFEVNSQSGGGIDLYLAEVTGDLAKDAVRVALPGGGSPFGGSGQVAVNAVWQKDGYVVFEASNQGGNFRIYYRKDSGGSPGELIQVNEVPGNLTFPAVSPDAQRVAFVSDQSGSGDIKVRDSRTGQITQVTSNPSAELFPIFSQDGTKLLFTRKHDGGQDVFEIAASAGASEVSVASGGGDQTRPSYAAGGFLTYFDGSRGEDHWDLVAVGGGNKRTVARDVRLPLRARPAQSPDGQWVAYTWNDPTKGDKVVLARVDGSKTVEVDTEFTACGEPALTQANGRTVLAFTALPSSGADWRFLYLMDVTSKLQ